MDIFLTVLIWSLQAEQIKSVQGETVESEQGGWLKGSDLTADEEDSTGPL